MSFKHRLEDDVRAIIAEKENKVEEKKMFGGICFMVNDRMCVGVKKERLMFRIDPEMFETVVEMEGCVPMNMNGKIMKGYVFVDADVLTTKKKLFNWMNLALEFNKTAKSSKKKRNKIYERSH